MKTIFLGIIALIPLCSFAKEFTLVCKNPEHGKTNFRFKSAGFLNLKATDITQITHSKVKAEYWEVTGQNSNTLTLLYLLEDGPASMYLEGKYQVTLSQQREYTATYYRRHDGKTSVYPCHIP